MNDIKELYNQLYSKLKQAIYYHNDLFLQEKLSKYEISGKKEEEEVLKVLTSLIDKNEIFEENEIEEIIVNWISNISYHFFPKTISFNKDDPINNKNKQSDPNLTESIDNKNKQLISNVTTSTEYYCSNEVNYHIDLPIPLFILDVLWILEIGTILDQQLSDNCYANRLHEILKNKKYKYNSSHLFKKYANQYNEWRLNAINCAKEIISKKEDAYIISLDFKSFYYSIDIDFRKIEEIIINNSKSEKQYYNILELKSVLRLNSYLEKIQISYSEQIKEHMEKTHKEYLFENDNSNNSKVLPIGLFSSYVLSNWYIKDFDKEVLDKLSPRYYGRYVDDSIFVLSKLKYSDKTHSKRLTDDDIQNIMHEFFIQKNILSKPNNDYLVCCRGIPPDRITIKYNKIKIFQIDSNHSTSLLRLFEKLILENQGVFKYLPEVPMIELFESDLYKLIFTENANEKLRGIERLSLHQSAFSILLAKQLSHLRICGKPITFNDEFIEQILHDLSGKDYLLYIRSWEKLFTLLVLSEKPDLFKKIFFDIYNNIKLLKYSSKENSNDSSVLEDQIKSDLKKYLRVSIIPPLALISPEERTKYLPSLEFLQKDDPDVMKISDSINSFRESNLIRQQHVVYPLLNYIKNYNGNLCNIDVFSENLPEKISLDKIKISKTPRFIHMHEFQLYSALECLRNHKSLTKCNHDKKNEEKIESNAQKTEEDTPKIEGYISNAKKDFSEKYKWIKYDKYIKTEALKKITFERSKEIHLTKITINSNPNSEKIKKENTGIKLESKETNSENKNIIRIGISNIYLPYEDIKNNLDPLKKQNTSLKKWLQISQILNTAKKENCNLVVFPECTMPYRWLSSLTQWTREHQIALIFGMEHVLVPKLNEYENSVTKSEAYNLTVALLPFQVKDLYNSCFISLRLKNHYACSEKRDIINAGHLIPEQYYAVYHLYNWMESQFTIYNCLELADIQHRGIFRSQLDYLIGCSWNKDTTYFMDIMQSVTRDLHCYVIYSNTSEFGCSRIIQPTNRERRNIAQIGGGKNCTLLVGDLDIDSLVDFQSKRDICTQNTDFKPLPPGFNSQLVIERHKPKKSDDN